MTYFSIVVHLLSGEMYVRIRADPMTRLVYLYK